MNKIRKLNHQPGLALGEVELSHEQSYHSFLRRLHNYHMHGWGIVKGFEVTEGDNTGEVNISEGIAILKETTETGLTIGKELIWFDSQNPRTLSNPAGLGEVSAYLYITWSEVPEQGSAGGLSLNPAQNGAMDVYGVETPRFHVEEIAPPNDGTSLILAKVVFQNDVITDIHASEPDAPEPNPLRKYIREASGITLVAEEQLTGTPGTTTLYDRLKALITSGDAQWPYPDLDGKVETSELMKALLRRVSASVIPYDSTKSILEQITSMDASVIAFDQTTSLAEKINSLATQLGGQGSSDFADLISRFYSADLTTRNGALDTLIQNGYLRSLPIFHDAANLFLMLSGLLLELADLDESTGLSTGKLGSSAGINLETLFTPSSHGEAIWRLQKTWNAIPYFAACTLYDFLIEKGVTQTALEAIPVPPATLSNHIAIRNYFFHYIYKPVAQIAEADPVVLNLVQLKDLIFEFFEYLLDQAAAFIRSSGGETHVENLYQYKEDTARFNTATKVFQIMKSLLAQHRWLDLSLGFPSTIDLSSFTGADADMTGFELTFDMLYGEMKSFRMFERAGVNSHELWVLVDHTCLKRYNADALAAQMEHGLLMPRGVSTDKVLPAWPGEDLTILFSLNGEFVFRVSATPNELLVMTWGSGGNTLRLISFAKLETLITSPSGSQQVTLTPADFEWSSTSGYIQLIEGLASNTPVYAMETNGVLQIYKAVLNQDATAWTNEPINSLTGPAFQSVRQLYSLSFGGGVHDGLVVFRDNGMGPEISIIQAQAIDGSPVDWHSETAQEGVIRHFRFGTGVEFVGVSANQVVVNLTYHRDGVPPVKGFAFLPLELLLSAPQNLLIKDSNANVVLAELIHAAVNLTLPSPDTENAGTLEEYFSTDELLANRVRANHVLGDDANQRILVQTDSGSILYSPGTGVFPDFATKKRFSGTWVNYSSTTYRSSKIITASPMQNSQAASYLLDCYSAQYEESLLSVIKLDEKSAV